MRKKTLLCKHNAKLHSPCLETNYYKLHNILIKASGDLVLEGIFKGHFIEFYLYRILLRIMHNMWYGFSTRQWKLVFIIVRRTNVFQRRCRRVVFSRVIMAHLWRNIINYNISLNFHNIVKLPLPMFLLPSALFRLLSSVQMPIKRVSYYVNNDYVLL